MIRIKSFRSLLLLAVVAVMVITLVGVTVPTAQAQGGETNYQPGTAVSTASGYAALAQRAAQNGIIRVIVSFGSAAYGQLAAVQAGQQRLANVLAISSNARVVREFTHTPAIVAELDQAAVIALANDPDVTAMQEDIPVPPSDLSSNNVIGASTVATGAWAQGYDGTGWAVVVLDTGAQSSHPFLSGKTITAAEACFSTTNGAYPSTTVCPNGQSTGGSGQPAQTGSGAGVNCPITTDGCAHGTHVSGIAVGKNYGGGPGYDGVARGASLIPIQVFSQFTGANCTNSGYSSPCAFSFNSDTIAALDYVYGTLSLSYNIASINMSLGGGQNTGYCDTDARKPVIDNLRNNRKIATVIAAGNNGYNNAISSPGCISSAVSVGATTDADAIASYSNRYANLSIYAPGSSIDSSVPNSTYANYNGTSMATPHVAGAWAVMKQKFPAASVSKILYVLRQKGPLIANTGGPVFSIPRLQLDKSLADFGNKDTVGIYRPSLNMFLLRNSNTTGVADINVSLAPHMDPNEYRDVPVVGDWNGDGIDTVGFYRRGRLSDGAGAGLFWLTDSNTAPQQDYYFVLGNPGDTPIVGDWNGDGKDTVGVFRPSNGLIYIKNNLTTGVADYTMVLGNPNDVGLAGNWDNDDPGTDSPGVFRPSLVRFYMTNQVCNCVIGADYTSVLGNPGDQGFVGDWNGDGRSGTGVYRTSNGITYLRNDPTTTGFSDYNLVYGIDGDYALAGHWSLFGPGAGSSTPSQVELAPTFVPKN
ncbi:MAG: S8 family serine peptidase [Anaerolineae bacterium]